MKVTPSNGQVGTPDFFSGTAWGLIQTSDFKHCFIRALLHAPLVDYNISFIFAFFIVHFLLVENTYKNRYSLKAVKIVCARTVRLSVPVIYFGYRVWFHSDLA
jgi:hypothetical protein